MLARIVLPANPLECHGQSEKMQRQIATGRLFNCGGIPGLVTRASAEVGNQGDAELGGCHAYVLRLIHRFFFFA